MLVVPTLPGLVFLLAVAPVCAGTGERPPHSRFPGPVHPADGGAFGDPRTGRRRLEHGPGRVGDGDGVGGHETGCVGVGGCGCGIVVGNAGAAVGGVGAVPGRCASGAPGGAARWRGVLPGRRRARPDVAAARASGCGDGVRARRRLRCAVLRPRRRLRRPRRGGEAGNQPAQVLGRVRGTHVRGRHQHGQPARVPAAGGPARAAGRHRVGRGDRRAVPGRGPVPAPLRQVRVHHVARLGPQGRRAPPARRIARGGRRRRPPPEHRRRRGGPAGSACPADRRTHCSTGSPARRRPGHHQRR